VTSLAFDSRKVEPGALFFAVKGGAVDGHDFLTEVRGRGAVAVVSERPFDPASGLGWVQVGSVRRMMALCAEAFFGSPSSRMRLIGITGTNGKTTTAFITNRVLNLAGGSAMIGTVENRVKERVLPTALTTPESLQIQAVLSEALREGCRYGVMEVSSHALFQQRVYGCRFPVAVFTNLTQDHLDFHQNLENYFAAKSLLFDPLYNPGIETSVVNGDDPWGQVLVRRLPAVVTYGLEPTNDVCPASWTTGIKGTSLDVSVLGRGFRLESPLPGRHNVYNLLAAATACRCLGIPEELIQEGVRSQTVVPGRFEKVDVERPFSVVIDYAHSPDALENVLRLAREVTEGRLICVFGCGGDRDRTKRPKMGAISARLADVVIVTSDNPRTEDPAAIVNEILTGIPAGREGLEVVVDRRRAIRHALEIAREGDLVLLAGKGHETYQDVGGRKNPFDERVVVREELCSK